MADTLRSCIVPEEGYTLISLDASQIELRVLGFLSGDSQMIEDLRTGDLHLAVAIRMFGWTDDEVEMKERRYKAKQGNFADVYGADEQKLAEMLDCTVEEAQKFQKERKETYPVLYQWMKDRVSQARREGYVKNMFGRIRPIPELTGGSWKMREKAEKEVVNTIVQGTAVDIVKMAGLYLRSVMDSEVRFVLQVHDEWVLECPIGLIHQTLKKCKELELAFPQYPFVIKVGKKYSELEEIQGD